MILQYTLPDLILREPLMELDESRVNVRHGPAPQQVWQHVHLATLNIHLHEHSWGLFTLQTFRHTLLILPLKVVCYILSFTQ